MLFFVNIMYLVVLNIKKQSKSQSESNFSTQTYNEHTYILYKSCIIHDPDCECGGSDLEPELNLVDSLYKAN